MPFDEKPTIRRNNRPFRIGFSSLDHFYVRRNTPIPDDLIMLMPQWHCRFRSIESACFCCYDRLRRALPDRGRAAPRKAFWCNAQSAFGIRHSAFGIRGTVFNRL